MIDLTTLYRPAILKSFKENFEKYKDKKIVIYGTGDVAYFIMSEFSDYNIIGFLDGTRTCGTAYGKRIFSYEEMIKHKPDMIIVAAKKDNMRIIYDRICYMCYTHKIPVYAVDGRNLFTAFGYGGLTAEQEKYGEINELMLREEIQKHDIISFDIFDVLLMRKTLIRTDVFDIVENRLSEKGLYIQDYKEIRLKAELDIIDSCGTINDIYKKIIQYTGISEEAAEQALLVELEAEGSIICSRDKMKELLLYAVDKGKQVYLLADSYFPVDIIKDLLKNHGITQYKNIFLSCEYHKTKEQGLFDIFKNETKGQAYLHIGASAEEDAVYKGKIHIDTFMIRSAYDMFCMSSYRNLKYSLNSINERSMAGMLIARVFNNPFSLYDSAGRPEIDSLYDFGYAFVAPLLTKYVLWIIDELKKGQYEDVLFAARDGLITQKLYNFALQELNIELPKGIYFQTSRTVCTTASVKDEADIRWIANVPHAYAPDLMMRRRFNLETEDIIQYDGNKYPDVVDYALQFKERIYQKSEALRENYLKYMENAGLRKNCKYAFVDFVSSGTCQLLLNKFIPFAIEGLYFCRYAVEDEAKMILPVRSLFENLHKEYVYCSYAYEKYLLLETMMTSLQPSLASIGENGQPIYGLDVRSETELQYVIDIHNAIEDYFCDFIKNSYIKGHEVHKHFVDTILSFREQKYTNEHCSAFDNLLLLEDFGQWEMQLDRSY